MKTDLKTANLPTDVTHALYSEKDQAEVINSTQTTIMKSEDWV